MANIFCPSCGARSDYQFSVPNFCSKCGKAYLESKIETFTNQMRSAKTKKKTLVNEDDFEDEDLASDDYDEEYSSSMRVPKIRKLDVDIDSSTDVKVFKFGDLVNQNLDSSFERGKSLNLEDLIDRDES